MNVRLLTSLASLCAIGAILSSCGQKTESTSGGSAGSGEFVKIQGAGASFPAPLYSSWFKKYTQANEGVQVDYQSVGSGSGVKMFMEGTVDFGASDAAMKPEEIEQVPEGVQLLPMTAGSIVLAYNLEGLNALKLSRSAYTGIFLGNITKWNDPAIAASNPGASLPDQNINVVVRSDSSGTTFVFTKHLSAISDKFAESPGTNKKPNWPVGIQSKGNEGVTQTIATTPGSIGYIEFGYAVKSKLNMVALENRAGNFIAPSVESAQAALAAIEMPDDLIAWAPDPEGVDAYPIITYTWLLCYKKYSDADKAAKVKAVVEFCLDDEQQRAAQPLGYIPLPAPVVTQVRAALQNIGS